MDGSNEGVSETIRIGAAKKTGGRLGTVYFVDSRFRDNANADPAQKHQVAKWRMKQRVPFSHPPSQMTPYESNLLIIIILSVNFCATQMKTVSVALVCCLNIGVDPPDVMKPSPCARLECWLGKAASSSHLHLTSLSLFRVSSTSYTSALCI